MPIMPNEPMIMNPNPQLDMKPVGSLNIPRFDEFDERIRRFEQPKIPDYNPIKLKFEPIKMEPIKFDLPKYEPPKYEPPPLLPIKEFELFPKKNFWDKI